MEKFSPRGGMGKKLNLQIEEDFWDVPDVVKQQVTIDPKELEKK